MNERHGVQSANLIHGRETRRQSHEKSVTDGPYIETKELIAGFMIVEARDLDEAVELFGRLSDSTGGFRGSSTGHEAFYSGWFIGQNAGPMLPPGHRCGRCGGASGWPA